jgi:hypothetical protein
MKVDTYLHIFKKTLCLHRQCERAERKMQPASTGASRKQESKQISFDPEDRGSTFLRSFPKLQIKNCIIPEESDFHFWDILPRHSFADSDYWLCVSCTSLPRRRLSKNVN